MGAIIPTPKNFTYGYHSFIGMRPSMEDASEILLEYGNPDQSFFGVFDGHNGSRCSRYLSSELPKTILNNPKFTSHPQIALLESFLETDKQWIAYCKKQGIKDGSTAIVAILRGDQLYVANTGDSRAIICDDGMAIPLSSDHKPSDTREKKRILDAGAHVLLGRVQGVLAVSRAFGDIDFKNRETCGAGWISAEPDVKLWNVTEKTEFFLLACDGVWDVMSTFQVAKFVREKLLIGFHPQVVAEQLVYHVHRCGSTDNISVVLVSLLSVDKIRRIHQTKCILKEVKEIGLDMRDRREILKRDLTKEDKSEEQQHKQQQQQQQQTILSICLIAHADCTLF
eukprot:TRINITY_DN694_c3_g4_i2.p1 TRINITY_DN694_c3_g4~~TRINITY_DN694_c3_g4_i2.p1  ORF type:complete len:339 (+),score=72.00 TRINITY_DN694_c3_g4_i2:42-1058(+)